MTIQDVERLDFILPDFTRIIWVSDRAQDKWANHLARIADRFSQLEILSVARGQRHCTLVLTSPDDLIQRAKTWLEYGLSFIPLERTGVSRHSYSSTPVPFDNNKCYLYRVVVGKPNYLSEFQKAWEFANDAQVGNLLGYPDCCIRFFHDCWVKQRHVDTTWNMAIGTRAKYTQDRLIEVHEPPPQTNILWRWAGIRAVPYLPCSFDCTNTVTFAETFWKCGDTLDRGEYRNLMEILSWPVEWSSLHAIAEIKTPILKVITRSDATRYKYTVRITGRSYPTDGARGLHFPYDR